LSARDGLRLVLPDGEPNNPALFVTAVPNWTADEVSTLGDGEQLRIVAITDPSEKPAARGFSGIFAIEPIRS
jgi:hypothetical protein